MISDIILPIIMLYLISIIVVGFINFDGDKIDFCKQNGFQEYGNDGKQEFCFNKLFEENKLFFEKNSIYCEPEPWFELFYYQPPTETCYLLKESTE